MNSGDAVGKQTRIRDLTTTILHLNQLPISTDLDGKSFADNPQKPPTAQIKVEGASVTGTSFELP